MCFQDCSTLQVLFDVGGFGLLIVGMVVLFLAMYRTTDKTEVSHPTTTTEEPTVRVGQRILYNASDGLECYFVITRVDNENSDVYGHFFVELPVGSEALNPPHFDRDEQDVYVTFKTPTKGASEVKFGVYYDPDELDGYDIMVEGVKAEPASAI